MTKYLYLAVFMLIFAACSKTRFEDHSHGHDHDHSHSSTEGHGHGHTENEVENIKITKFSANYEIFAEINPFVVGQESEFIIHYTKLTDFKPVTTGYLSIILSGSINDVLKIDTVARPGIYLATYTPQNSGNFNLSFILNDGNIADTIRVEELICYTSKEEAERNTKKSEDGIVFLKEEAWKIDFGLEKIGLTNFRNSAKAVAKVVYNPKDLVYVTANISGIIEIYDNSLVEGKKVTKGTRLFTIMPNSTRDDNYAVRYEQAKAEFNRAKGEFSRISELFSSKLTTEKEYLEAKSAFERADAVFRNYSKYSDGKSNIVKATASGTITQILISSGQYIEAGMPIAVIANSESLVLELEIPKNELYRLGQINTINLIYANEAFDLTEYGLKQIGQPIISNNSSLASVKYLFKNERGVLPNSVVDVYVKGSSIESSITVPKESVWEDQGHYYVFVQKNGELFEKREVFINGFDGFRYQISGGLNDGEVVVTKGAYRVMLASKSSELPANAHTH